MAKLAEFQPHPRSCADAMKTDEQFLNRARILEAPEIFFPDLRSERSAIMPATSEAAAELAETTAAEGLPTAQQLPNGKKKVSKIQLKSSCRTLVPLAEGGERFELVFSPNDF